jgi:hypothetical protein
VQTERHHPSLSKRLARAIERLGRAAGHLERPDAFRDGVAALVTELSVLREEARTARGDARDAIAQKLPDLDRRIVELARASSTVEVRREAEREAALELASYRDRLPGDAWQRAVDAVVDQRLRDRLGLPALEP